MPTSSKKRPGVAAAVLLASSTDSNLWERIEQQYESIRSENLKKADDACCNLLDNDSIIHKNDLMELVQWKFAVGKPRPQNLGLLRSNSEATVKDASHRAIHLAQQMNMAECTTKDTGELTNEGTESIKKALHELTVLKGVGPATATAILCRCRPDLFCYMYDEVIDAFEPKRDYTVNIYLRINSRCLEIAQKLGGGDWTTARVAKVLWTAARVLAADNDGPEDLTATLMMSKPTSIQKSDRKAAGVGKTNDSVKQATPTTTTSRKRRKTKK